MRCDEFETRLNACLDARSDPEADELLSLHFQDCDHCRQLSEAYSLIGESLKFSDRPEPSEKLMPAVLAEVASSAPASSTQWSVWTHVALASAAALLVVVMLPRERTKTTLSPPVATIPSAVGAIAHAPQTATPTLPAGQLAREATARYASLARTTSDSLSGVLALWQPANTQPAPEPGDAAMLEEMAAGLRPLADSTTGAVRFLLNVLPQGADAADAPPEPVSPRAT